MTDQAAAKPTIIKPSKGAAKPERLKPGTLPPYLKLSEAFKLTTEVYNQGGGRANADLMSKLTGNTSSSSSYVKKVNALKAYGLVTEENGELVLTDIGSSIAAPVSHEAAATAKKNSLLTVEKFYQLYERHKGKLLPDDQFLKNIMEQNLSIPKAFVDTWMEAFKDAIQAAGLSSRRQDGKTQILEGASTQVQGKPNDSKVFGVDVQPPLSPPLDPPPSTGVPIPLGRDKVARLELPQEFKAADLPRLLQVICIALGDGDYDIAVTKIAKNSPVTE